LQRSRRPAPAPELRRQLRSDRGQRRGRDLGARRDLSEGPAAGKGRVLAERNVGLPRRAGTTHGGRGARGRGPGRGESRARGCKGNSELRSQKSEFRTQKIT